MAVPSTVALILNLALAEGALNFFYSDPSSHALKRLPTARKINLPALVARTNQKRGKPDRKTPKWRNSDMLQVGYRFEFRVLAQSSQGLIDDNDNQAHVP